MGLHSVLLGPERHSPREAGGPAAAVAQPLSASREARAQPTRAPPPPPPGLRVMPLGTDVRVASSPKRGAPETAGGTEPSHPPPPPPRLADPPPNPIGPPGTRKVTLGRDLPASSPKTGPQDGGVHACPQT